ncbi:MAG: PEGA domain-containing protein [Pseudomonadota bacterium]
MELDSRIQQAKKRNALMFLVLGIGSFLVILLSLIWIFLVKGYVIVVAPDDAREQFAVETLEGVLWESDGRLYLIGSQAQIKVSAPTFEPVTVAIDPNTPQNIEVVLPPKPATILSSLATNDDTSWYIDNNLVFVGSTFEYEIAHGTYDLRIENPFFQTFEQSVTLSRGEVKSMDIALQSFSGSVALAASVENASITLDNSEYAMPLNQALESGQYAVTISAPGYQTIEDQIDITWQQPDQVRNYNLIPQQAGLDIQISPPGGTLLVDGKTVQSGVTLVDSNRKVDVRYSLAGFYPFQQVYTLDPGEQQSLDINLEPARGRLSITSNLKADVMIDGKSVGSTPLAIELPAVSHRVEIARQGYRSVRQQVSIVAEQDQKIDVNLITEYEARRAEGRPTAAQQLGIIMRPFTADAYTMGSPVNQPGRRRNEHPIKVDFSRSFTVSVHEITEAQFAAATGKSSNSKLPQTNLTWTDAARFTNWLSQQDGLPPFYTFRGNQVVGVDKASTGYRLLMEAEWEWLAKKANRQVGTTFVWGNGDRIPKDVGNFADESRKGQQPITLSDYEDGQAGVAPVGSFRADRLGLHDLAGNVSEWVHDRYTNSIPDLSFEYVDYAGPTSGELNVTKGGNFTVGKLRDLRTAYREPAGEAKDYIGFRIARYIE